MTWNPSSTISEVWTPSMRMTWMRSTTSSVVKLEMLVRTSTLMKKSMPLQKARMRHFRDNIRFFNGHFSFTTLGVSLDNNYTNMRSGVYTFRTHGQMYHNVHSFGPRDSGPDHLQLYFYDDHPTLQHCFRHSPSFDQEVIRKLVNILRDNPYSQFFRSLGQTEDLAEYRISLNIDQRLDQRRYNVPVSSEVAAVWVEGNDLVRKFEQSVILYGNDNTEYGIQPYYGCYDPLSYPLFFPRGELGWHLSYPLFFPRGELGWHPQIPKVGVSLDEVLQSNENEDNDPG